jgi:hypothetical protein
MVWLDSYDFVSPYLNGGAPAIRMGAFLVIIGITFKSKVISKHLRIDNRRCLNANKFTKYIQK